MMTMKDFFTVAATLLFFIASSGFVAMGNMLMGNSLGEYLSELVSFDSITMTQMDDILTIADNTTSSNRFEMFETDESKDVLRTYLYAEVSASNMEEYTAEMIASIASLGESLCTPVEIPTTGAWARREKIELYVPAILQ